MSYCCCCPGHLMLYRERKKQGERKERRLMQSLHYFSDSNNKSKYHFFIMLERGLRHLHRLTRFEAKQDFTRLQAWEGDGWVVPSAVKCENQTKKVHNNSHIYESKHGTLKNLSEVSVTIVTVRRLNACAWCFWDVTAPPSSLGS